VNTENLPRSIISPFARAGIILISIVLVFLATMYISTKFKEPTNFDYGEITSQIIFSDQPEEMCANHIPWLGDVSRGSSIYWNHAISPTTVTLDIYPSVSVSNDIGLVWFYQEQVDVQEWIPTQNGRKTETVTDPDKYNQFLSEALQKTGNNRGYRVVYKKVFPLNNLENLHGTCTPIPY